ncbi:MAG: hypothetical protein LBM16_04090 [Clostridiales bacterium]|jgi:hypothetical protein|nr:hypothetical protein [Clostridiales bacterium]
MNYIYSVYQAIEDENYPFAGNILEKNKQNADKLEYIKAKSEYAISSGQLELAQETLDVGLKMFPDDFDLLCNYAFLYENKRFLCDAFITYKKAREAATELELKKQVDIILDKLRVDALRPLNEKGRWYDDDFRPPATISCIPSSPYYIVCPAWTSKSAGVRAMHFLCNILNNLGWEAYVTDTPSPKLNTPLLTPEIIQRHKKTGRFPIAVYNESFTGSNSNPYDAPVVVRWLLFHPKKGEGWAPYTGDELLFHWVDTYKIKDTDSEPLIFDNMEHDIFYYDALTDKNRNGYCIYAYKYLLENDENDIEKTVFENGTFLGQKINMTKAQLSDILRKSKFLICYEISAICEEAALCGCPTFLIKSDYLESAISNMFEDNMYKSYILGIIDESEVKNISDTNFDFRMFESQMKDWYKKKYKSVGRFIEKTQDAIIDFIKQ